jgi:hypothetical protein
MPGGKPHTFAQQGHERWQKDENGQHMRNKRSVWTVTTKPFKDSHFATFPEDLISPMILAGCPEFVCSVCGKPYERKTETEKIKRYRPNEFGKREPNAGMNTINQTVAGCETKTLGFEPTCSCQAETIPGVCLDPFMGAGTTALVARKLNRNYIGIELNQKYIDMANKRLTKELGLFNNE